MTHALIEQLGSVVESLKPYGFVETFGFDPDELPKKIDIERWYTPAHWGADQATLEKRKKGVELLPYEKRFKDEVRSILSGIYDDYMPVEISGEIQFMLNRTRSGWLIGLVNNHGVTKERMTPVKLDLSQKKNVEIMLKSGEINGVYEWYLEREISVDGNKFNMEIPPGEIRIVEIQCDD